MKKLLVNHGVWKSLLVMLLYLLLAGCTTSFTYNQLDWLIPWYVDGYVDLTRDQKKTLRYELEPFLDWHRNEELESYIEILDDIEAGIAAPLSAAQVLTWIEEIVAAAERTELTMLDVGLQFGGTLSDDQIQEFVDSLWERQREYEEEFLQRTEKEYASDNYDNLKSLLSECKSRAEFWNLICYILFILPYSVSPSE